MHDNIQLGVAPELLLRRPADAFRNDIGRHVFQNKYSQEGKYSWDQLAAVVVDDVCGTMGGTMEPILSASDRADLTHYIATMKFIPGGRYLYYAGRPLHAYNNCFLLSTLEDTREEWAAIVQRAMACLIIGGGIGVDYSVLRPKGTPLSRTGGEASGPLPLMRAVNEIGRNVMQGGSRRSAIYASLNWQHRDAPEFLRAKNWSEQMIGPLSLADLKQQDFNFPAPLDMTNISLNYDDAWLDAAERESDPTFRTNVLQAMRTGEPGFSFNFREKQRETLRNAPVCAGTMIMTTNGYQAVRDIVGRRVSVWTGQQWADDVEFKLTDAAARTVVVKMAGGRVIQCDLSHPFLVERYSGAGKKRHLDHIERVPAASLQAGDILHVSLPPVSRPAAFDHEAYTLGYLYGDGHFSHTKGNADVSFCTVEKLPCAAVVERSQYLSSVTPRDARGYRRAYFRTDHDYFGARAKSIFPADLFAASPEEQVSFLAGLFDADGNVCESQHRIRLSSNHWAFLRDVARLLEHLGILANVSSNGSSTFGDKQTYQLVIMADYVARFVDTIPTVRLALDTHEFIPYRRSRLTVRAVRDGGVAPVFCADVGVPEHSFMAEGVIIANCTEITSEDDSDVCNLGSVNLANIDTVTELAHVTDLASQFLVCGTLRADLPYAKVGKVREQNRRLGLGMMGIHEWLLKTGHRYEMVPELRRQLAVWEAVSELSANALCDKLSISRPKGYRAIAPTGTIGLIAGTTTGIEPVYAVAYQRRYLMGQSNWKYEYVVDQTAQTLIDQGVNPDTIETAVDLAQDFERRIKFQADVQDYVDHAISSTINLPAWGSEYNNESLVPRFAETLAKYAPRLRGFTCYPDGSRGGQPLVPVAYAEAKDQQGLVFEDNDSCKGGVCGI